MDVKIEKSWKKALKTEFEKKYFQELTNFVKGEYQKKKVYPAPQNIFRAFDLCPLDQVKVVILGQDPYHGPKQANGLCFSVSPGLRFPPSLQNIFKEMLTDLQLKDPPKSGDLEAWAKQGVLLLNATLTVEARKAGSHQQKGWEELTDAAIKTVSEQKEGVVFILWGRYAQNKTPLIDTSKHLIIKSPHPSPFSANRGFFGSRPFSQTNAYLKQKQKAPINWAEVLN